MKIFRFPFINLPKGIQITNDNRKTGTAYLAPKIDHKWLPIEKAVTPILSKK
jgi:hypothetical protein